MTADQAAIEAGAQALFGNDSLWADAGPGHRAHSLSQARAAYAAMEPHIRKAVAEEIAVGGCCVEYGIFQDCTADGLGHAFIATRHDREDADAAVTRLQTEHPDYPAYAKKRTVRHGAWEPLDGAREIGAKP